MTSAGSRMEVFSVSGGGSGRLPSDVMGPFHGQSSGSMHPDSPLFVNQLETLKSAATESVQAPSRFREGEKLSPEAAGSQCLRHEDQSLNEEWPGKGKFVGARGGLHDVVRREDRSTADFLAGGALRLSVEPSQKAGRVVGGLAVVPSWGVRAAALRKSAFPFG